MSRLVEEEAKYSDDRGSHEEFIIQCDTGDGDYLRATWDEFDPEWRYLWIEATVDNRWRSRIKAAWRNLRGRHPEVCTILLNQEAVKSLREFLADK